MQKFLCDFSVDEFYPPLIKDYLKEKEELKQFYTYPPTPESIPAIIKDCQKKKFERKLIYEVVSEQYSRIHITAPNAEKLLKENTFTVCTGHQLCLFTGPLFFIYKILSTIKLAEQLESKFPEFNFVPLFWMAGEDHDFEEINHINLFGKKYEWKNKQGGATSLYRLDGIEEIIAELKTLFEKDGNASSLLQLFSDAYLKHSNLGDATRYLLHHLFGYSGLVILDPSDKRLKQLFSTIIEEELFHQKNFHFINSTAGKIKSNGYLPQVNPREINLFFLSENERTRIEKTHVEEDEKLWRKRLIEETGRFSPNVVLRPLFQQKILPNIAYTGGPGEISYWLELKEMFDRNDILFPLLFLRNSVFFLDKKTAGLMNRFDISEAELFENADLLINKFISKTAGKEIDLNEAKKNLHLLFKNISQKAANIDSSLILSVEAELQKSLNSIENIERKMLKAEKQRNETAVSQIRKMKEKIFPEKIPQERYYNILAFYSLYGNKFFPLLKEHINPFERRILFLKES